MKRIETQNLILRKAKKEDLNKIWNNIWKDEKIAETMLWKPTKTYEEALQRLERTIKYQESNYAYFICLKENDEPIGFAGIKEIEENIYEESGICIATKCQGKGYGKEVLKALEYLVFEKLNGDKFLYGFFKDNEKSKRVCLSQGFKYLKSGTIVREWDNKEFENELYYQNKEMYFERKKTMVMLIHGYNGVPKIFQYIKDEMEKRNYNVEIPEFPIRKDITVAGYFEVLDKYKEKYKDKLIVIAHSIGNPMIIKYVAKNKLNIDTYISLAGFSKSFIMEGNEDLNMVLQKVNVNDEEIKQFKRLVNNKCSIYSDNDHVVPFEILEKFYKIIDAKPILIKDVGHMGNHSGIEKLKEVIDIIDKQQ